jgi:hypothetical protein
MNILHKWTHEDKPNKLWLTNLWEAEISDAQGDGRMTYEDSYMIRTGLWVNLDDNDEPDLMSFQIR